MFKFLRKYNRFILAVGGSLLVIVFLVPQAIQGLADQAAQRSAEIATVGLSDEDVSITDWNQVQAESQIMQSLGISFSPLPPIDNAEHWFLLTREAEQLGFVPTRPTGAFSRDLTDENLTLLARNLNAPPSLILETLAKAQGVSRLIATFVQAGEMSDRRLQQFAQKLFHAVGMQTVVITADAEHLDINPTQQELQQQLDQYKDVPPGEGDHGFGYKLPNRAQLEQLTISAESVREAITKSDKLNGRVLQRHWLENAGLRGLPLVEKGVQVPDVVREDLLDQLTDEELDLIEKFAYDSIRIPQRELSRKGGFYELPDDWAQQRIDFQDLATKIQERFNIEQPTYDGPDDQWLTIDELSKLPGIGSARTSKFGRLAATLAEIVARAREFDGDGTIPIQQGVAGPPLQGNDGSVYLFRITDTDPARPPASVDEVREQLVKDLRRLANYEQLVQQIDQIEETARTNGLLSLAMAYDSEVASDQRVALYEPDKYFIDTIRRQGLAAQPSLIPGLGDAPELLEEIIEWARTFDPKVKFDTLTKTQRTRAFKLDDQLAVVVVLLTKQYPVTVKDFKALMRNNQLSGLLINNEFDNGQSVRDAFSLPELTARHNFVSNNRNEDEDEDGEADADTDNESETEA